MSCSTLLFLDFDGVICDSAGECFESSLAACSRFHAASEGEACDSIEQAKEIFAGLRPYIRNSEDYCFIQEIIFKRIDIRSQADFDAYLGKAPKEKHAEYRRAFYDVRSRSYAQNREKWLNANPLYPHMLNQLRIRADNPCLFILSTKKPEFIKAILSHNGINIQSQRILESAENESKLEKIAVLLDRGAGETAAFVDDQVGHLLGNNDERISTFLPLWGYIDKTPPGRKNIRAIDENEMAELFGLLAP